MNQTHVEINEVNNPQFGKFVLIMTQESRMSVRRFFWTRAEAEEYRDDVLTDWGHAPTPAPEEEAEYTHMLQVEAGGKWADTDSFDEWEDAHATLTRCQRVGLNARVELRLKRAATVAALALALLVTIPHGCTVVGATGEGFPLGHCSDDTYGYVDMDGTDGALGTVGDGRWVQLP